MTGTTAEIERIVAAGDPEAVTSASPAVLAECARRYVTEQIKRRQRGSVRQAERRAAVASVDAAMLARMRQAARDYARETIVWTGDLLRQNFRLADGSCVTWGAATAEQHRERAESLERHAAGTVQTAALHRAAVEEITSSGKASLGEALT